MAIFEKQADFILLLPISHCKMFYRNQITLNFLQGELLLTATKSYRIGVLIHANAHYINPTWA